MSAPARPLRLHATEPLYGRAYHLADQGRSQQQIAETLEEEFPGLSDNYYLNPAAIATMDRVKREEQERGRDAANSEWRRQRGLSEKPRPPEETFAGRDEY